MKHQTPTGKLKKLVTDIQPEYAQDIPEAIERIRRLAKSCVPKKKTGFREMPQNKWYWSKGFNAAVEIMQKEIKKL